MASSDIEPGGSRPWYDGVTRYQWLVLAVACAGWVFDVYEGQIFNITRNQMLRDLGAEGADALHYGDVFLAIFLLGGTIGGLAAGSLADRYGRRPIMIVTILLYSIFSGLTYFATEIWHVAVLRFLVAAGVGGEWAVAASLVSEVFPARARAHASGIFHASSILGTWMAALAGVAVGAEWRYAYLLGIAPALLVLWVRSSVREPERWQAKAAEIKGGVGHTGQLGSFGQLLLEGPWNYRALLGLLLAAVGLATFWAVTVAGQDLARQQLLDEGVSAADASQRAKLAYGIVQTAGGGLGLLAFGPLSARVGRRAAFLLFHLAALAIVPATCFLPQSYAQLLMVLPVFGFLTMGMHAGYAIYFPELFPTQLRATGASFCFNGGRVAAAPVLVLSGWLKAQSEWDLRSTITMLSWVYLIGVLIVILLPETNRKELPD